MKGLILLQNSFEDHEALTTIDVLKRANIEIESINMSDNEILTSQYGNKVIVSKFYKDIDIDNYDFLVIPGGRAVSASLINDERVYKIIKYFVDNKKLVACICAAPVLLKEYLTKEFTCFPSYAIEFKGKYTGDGVMVLDGFVLAKSMYYTIPFALEIVNCLTNNKNLIKQLKAE